MRPRLQFLLLIAVLMVSAGLARPALSDPAELQSALNAAGFSKNTPLFIRVFKQESALEVWLEKDGDFALFKTYPVCAWSGTLGPKQKQGDRQSPEGFYQVSPDQMNPNSQFHLSFNLGYPNAYDRSHGRTGSYLMVHGNCVSIGCYAMTDSGIEEIYQLASNGFAGGQRRFEVHVFPFRMSKENMQAHKGDPWMPFWENLKTGYDLFVEDKRIPKISVRGQKYIFASGKSES